MVARLCLFRFVTAGIAAERSLVGARGSGNEIQADDEQLGSGERHPTRRLELTRCIPLTLCFSRVSLQVTNRMPTTTQCSADITAGPHASTNPILTTSIMSRLNNTMLITLFMRLFILPPEVVTAKKMAKVVSKITGWAAPGAGSSVEKFSQFWDHYLRDHCGPSKGGK
jgi:hypothetical protein